MNWPRPPQLRTASTMSLALKASLAAALFLATAGRLLAATPGDLAAPRSIGGTHFILLLDDSGDMAARTPAIAEVVAKALFDRDEANAKPVLDVARGDRLSVLFFGIHSGRAACRPKRDNSTLPEGMFEWVPPEEFEATRAGLNRFLVKELGRTDCRFRSHWTPANTAALTSLPAVQAQLLAAGEPRAFVRTLVVLVSNGLTNGPPSLELAKYRGEGVADTEETEQLVGAIGSWFGSPVEPVWARRQAGRDDNPITAQVYRIEPLKTFLAEQSLDFRAPVEVDRVATSLDQLRLVGRSDSGVLTISAAKLRPMLARWTFTGEDGSSPWPASGSLTKEARGEPAAASSYEADLGICQPPVCKREGDGVRVNLLASLGVNGEISASDPLPAPGKATFTVGFAYQNGFYSQSVIFSPSRTVSLRPVEPRDVRSGLLPVAYRLDNRGLTRWFRPADAALGLAQQQAAARAERRLELYQWVALAGLVALLILILWWFGHRGFQPRVTVTTRPSRVAIDGTNRAPFLVGSVKVENHASRPLFHHLFGRSFERRHKLTLVLSLLNWRQVAPELELVGDVAPIGFLPLDGGTIRLRLESVPQQDGAETSLYFDPDRIQDLQSRPSMEAGAVLEFEVQATVRWRRRQATSPKATLRVQMVPEVPREPTVEWLDNGTTTEFRGDDPALVVGRFALMSSATKLFARSFVGDYELQLTDRRREPLPAAALALVGLGVTRLPAADGDGAAPVFRLELMARRRIEVEVRLDCTQGPIKNPEAAAERYHIGIAQVAGRGGEILKPGFELTRDSRGANLRLVTKHREHEDVEHEIYWQGREVRRRRRGVSGTDEQALGQGLPPVTLDLEVTPNHQSQNHLIGEIELTNTGCQQGLVTVLLKASESFTGLAQATHGVIALRSAGKGPAENLELAPGATERIGILLRSRLLPPLTDGHGRCEFRVVVAARIDPGNGAVAFERHAELRWDLRLVERANDKWICIDFGTSAVSVAHGTKGDLQLADLQEVHCFETQREGQTFGFLEPLNQEAGTPFLPSVVCFPGPHRPDAALGRTGTPWGPTTANIGEPTFVHLPALTNDVRDNPNRVAHSLKTWLSDGRQFLVLPEEVLCEGERTRQLDLDRVLESVYRALVLGYILADDVRHGAHRLVLTHPNCFTGAQRQRLRKVAFAALGIGDPSRPDTRYLGLKNADRVALMSESDAVAYYHCWRRYERQDPWQVERPERILVYDLGAGTLDLSLVEVTWAASTGFVAEFRVKARLGVPLAGDAIDERLCRIVDAAIRVDIEAIRKEVSASSDIQYRFPLVRKRGEALGPEDRPKAIQEFRANLRKAKFEWAARAKEKQEIAATALEVVLATDRDGLIRVSGEAGRLLEDRDAVKLGLSTNKKNEHILRLAGRDIVSDPKMSELLQFLTTDCVDELLALADHGAGSVDTILVSGRAALWPGILERVGGRFPNALMPEWKTDDPNQEVADAKEEANEMKLAVARGAVAGHLEWFVKRHVDDAPLPRWGVLHDSGREVVLEDEWNAPLAIKGDTIDLVQVGISGPCPARDRPFGTPRSLRGAFYTRVLSQSIRVPRGTELISLEKRGEGMEAEVFVAASGMKLQFDVARDPLAPPTWLASHVLLEEP